MPTFFRCSVAHLNLFASLFDPLLQSRGARGEIVHNRQADFGQVQVVPTIAEGAFADVSFRSSDRDRGWCREPPWSQSESRSHG